MEVSRRVRSLPARPESSYGTPPEIRRIGPLCNAPSGVHPRVESRLRSATVAPAYKGPGNVVSIIAVVWVLAELLRMAARNQWRPLRSWPKPKWGLTEVALISVAVLVGGAVGPHLLASHGNTALAVGTWWSRDCDRRGLPFRREGFVSASCVSGMATVSEAVFDELIHAPLRLQICAMLSPVRWLPFSDIRDSLEISDSVLSKHLSALAEAGYVEVSRVRANSRSRRQVTLTEPGRTALGGHLVALQAIVAAAEPTIIEQPSGARAPERPQARRDVRLDPRIA